MTLSRSQFDVVVIGGGPGGASVATLIARAGHDVALFERQSFPRFQVGESLVPAVNLTLSRLGLLEDLDAKRFPRKHGVQFFSPKGPTRPFYFSEVADPRMHTTWQVLRSDFDELLLQKAQESGVEASTETEILDVLTDDGVVHGVRIRTADGEEKDIECRVVIDASGQQGKLARSHGQRSNIEGLENTAVFTHYKNARLDTGIDAGSTLIYRIGGSSWIWFIPLPDTVSIGLVAPARVISDFGNSPAEILDAAIAACEPLRERLVDAEPTMPVKAVRDISYRTEVDGGEGWALVGDALGFIDPIYSTGLFLTMFSAELGAAAVDAALRAGPGAPDLGGYATDYRVAFDRFLLLVQAFYREDFHFGELARNPIHRQGLIDLLTGIFDTPQAMAVTGAIQDYFDQQNRQNAS